MTIDKIEKVKFFVIRHKQTKQLMPLFKRNRGYSHWNPSTNIGEHPRSLGVPRILRSERQANACIVQWNALPNSRNIYDHDGEADIDIKPDGRTKLDLEVVAVKLYEVNK